MANFAPSFTPRYTLVYRAGGRTHSCLVRGAVTENQSATVTRGQEGLRAFFLALAPKLPDDLAFLSATYTPVDSNLSIPAGTPEAVTGGLPLSGFKTRLKIAKTQFSGKTSGGSKASINAWSLAFELGDDADADGADYIVTWEEDAVIEAAGLALTSFNFPGIDGTVVTWYKQVTIKAHDHYVKRVRRGI